jgi:hypothetical protein
VDLHGDEVLHHELLHARIRVDLGIQPSAAASKRRGVEVHEERTPGRAGLCQRGVHVAAPLNRHDEPSRSVRAQR